MTIKRGGVTTTTPTFSRIFRFLKSWYITDMGKPMLTDADFQLAELTAQFDRFFAHGAPHLHALLSLAKELSTPFRCRGPPS